MGVGNPEGNDTTFSAEGIVNGHAYAVVRVEDFEGELLIMLRNPHGKSDQCVEWNGDWSDTSEKWTQKAIDTLGYTPSESPDGIFWMNQTDLMQNFKNLYICRELSAKAGWHEISLNGEWFGPSAGGFPKKFRTCP